MDWSINDSLVTTAEVFEFEAPQAGSYEICGLFETPDCPTGGEECIVLEIADDCFADTQNEACQVAINMEEISCSSFSFSNNRQVVMDWRVNGELTTTAESFEFEAEVAGSYEICGLFETPECPQGGEACVTLAIAEGCFEGDDCEVALIVEDISCSSFFLSNDRQIVLDWVVNDSLTTTGEVFEFEALEAGSYEICGLFETPECPLGGEGCVTIDIEADCFADDACEVELDMTENSCSSFSFVNSRQVMMDWRVNGELTTTAISFEFEAEVEGSYEICGLFETPECPSGGEACITIVVMEDCFVDEACEVDLMVEDISCSSFFISNNRQIIMDYRVNGELVATTLLYTFEAEEAGSYEICGMFETPECPSGGEDCVTIDIAADCF